MSQEKGDKIEKDHNSIIFNLFSTKTKKKYKEKNLPELKNKKPNFGTLEWAPKPKNALFCYTLNNFTLYDFSNV